MKWFLTQWHTWSNAAIMNWKMVQWTTELCTLYAKYQEQNMKRKMKEQMAS